MPPNTHEVLAGLDTAFQAFKDNYDQKLRDLEGKLYDLETIAARPGRGALSRELEPQVVYDALAKFVRRGDVTGMLGGLGIQNAAQIAIDPDGGFFCPPEISREIERLQRDSSPMRQIARVVQGSATEYKLIVDKNNMSSGWVGETEGRPATTAPDLAEVTIPAKEVYANAPITQNLLDDAGWDAGEWLVTGTADEFTAQEGAAFVTGDGVKRPRGFLTYPTASSDDATRAWGTLQYVPSGDASAFVAASTTVSPGDCLMNLMYKLRARYRQGAVWTMNAATLATVRKFKDADGAFIWRPGIEAGQPSLLLGYPVVELEDMPDVGAGNYPIAFGNFLRGYRIVDRLTRMLRDPYTNRPYVQFYSTKRVGGACANFEAIKLLKIATT